jgi:hypothetical protein
MEILSLARDGEGGVGAAGGGSGGEEAVWSMLVGGRIVLFSSFHQILLERSTTTLH